jgi:hypothetical protein
MKSKTHVDEFLCPQTKFATPLPFRIHILEVTIFNSQRLSRLYRSHGRTYSTALSHACAVELPSSQCLLQTGIHTDTSTELYPTTTPTLTHNTLRLQSLHYIVPMSFLLLKSRQHQPHQCLRFKRPNMISNIEAGRCGSWCWKRGRCTCEPCKMARQRR